MNPFIDKFKMAGKVMDVCDSTARGLIATLQSAFNSLSRVAHTGSYNDLTDKPTIPTTQVNSDWNATSGVAEILHKPTLATVATSGSYNDLSNKPSIPAEQVNSDWNATSGKAQILNKPTLATVATSGSYNDLNNRPTNLFKWNIINLNNRSELNIKLNDVVFGNWTRYTVFYLCTGGGNLDYGIFMCSTANGVPNVTYRPIIESTNKPVVIAANIENNRVDFDIRRTATYDYLYLSMPEGNITVT